MADRAEILRATQRLAATWTTFVEPTAGADVSVGGGLIRCWADSPFSWWNIVIVPGDVASADELQASLAEGALYARAKRQAGSIRVADDLLALLGDARTEILTGLGLTEAGTMTEMIGLVSELRLRDAASLSFERVSDERALRALADINADAYGLATAAVRAGITGAPDIWLTRAYSYLAYECDELVCVASVLPHDRWLYLGLVATAPGARGRGLAAATVSHALRQAQEQTGIDRSDMHASDMGIPLYRRLGYRTTVAFRTLLLADPPRA